MYFFRTMMFPATLWPARNFPSSSLLFMLLIDILDNVMSFSVGYLMVLLKGSPSLCHRVCLLANFKHAANCFINTKRNILN